MHAFEHLPTLIAAGHNVFRIEAGYETPEYRLNIAKIYRAALERAAGGDWAVDESAWNTIREHTAVGLCNGFYFGRTGAEYVGKRTQAAGLPSSLFLSF